MTGDLDRRVAALAEAVDLAEGRLDRDAVGGARAIVSRAGERVGLGLESTVAALAGPTGAGKSTLFNALAGSDLAQVSRRRPTTASAAAAVWGDVGDALLDWLDIRRRHRLEDDALRGLVLIDLPDFDSVELDHRLEVDRMVTLADLLVWVVDPQKYADAAWHDRYLRRLSDYGAVMAVVLNQSDLLDPDELTACRRDLAALLEREGLAGVPLVVASARTGDGVEDVRRLLEERVRARSAAVARLAADVNVAASALAAECGERGVARVRRADRDRLLSALADAAAVPTVVRAVRRAHKRRGGLATGWPLTRWLRRLRPDPLRRLRLPEQPHEAVRTSLPGPTPVERARVATGLRALADGAASALPAPWPTLVRDAAVRAEDDLSDRLDRAVAGADLHVSRPKWWTGVGLLQKVLGLAMLVGAAWLLALVALGYLQLDEVVPVPEVEGVPVPTALLLGGAGAGLLVALLARVGNALGARRRARAAERSLRRRIEDVADERAIAPVTAELDAHDRLCELLQVARTTRRGSRLARTIRPDLAAAGRERR